MFSDRVNVNILVSLLVSHGIRRVVVCPGSRNSPIANDLAECADIICYPVTDERSAGFYALGMSLADNVPVAVCVTSGTALLNLAPAVAEASYRHHGLVVISADRPASWIDQLDGQTLRQQYALANFVSRSVSLPEPVNDEQYWYCNRLVNEALIAVKAHGRKSVHINVPISEPLFSFCNKVLPAERKINYVASAVDTKAFHVQVTERLLTAQRPMIVVGQLNSYGGNVLSCLQGWANHVVVLAEPLACDYAFPIDKIFAQNVLDESYAPDFILYLGDTVVSKNLKKWIRAIKNVECWAVSEDGDVHDTFMHLSGVIEGHPVEALRLLAENGRKSIDERESEVLSSKSSSEFVLKWKKLLDGAKLDAQCFNPPFSSMYAVKVFEKHLGKVCYSYKVHYANSLAVRLACIYSSRYVWCNRGVNGIEGSLSTAAGFSVATSDIVFCVIGDLSFFYDQNALWNTNVSGNLRILLLNNGGGGIFHGLAGLEQNTAFHDYVSASHSNSAKGICLQNNVRYLCADDADSLNENLNLLLTDKSERPVLLEVFTDSEKDSKALITYMQNNIKDN